MEHNLPQSFEPAEQTGGLTHDQAKEALIGASGEQGPTHASGPAKEVVGRGDIKAEDAANKGSGLTEEANGALSGSANTATKEGGDAPSDSVERDLPYAETNLRSLQLAGERAKLRAQDIARNLGNTASKGAEFAKEAVTGSKDEPTGEGLKEAAKDKAQQAQENIESLKAEGSTQVVKAKAKGEEVWEKVKSSADSVASEAAEGLQALKEQVKGAGQGLLYNTKDTTKDATSSNEEPLGPRELEGMEGADELNDGVHKAAAWVKQGVQSLVETAEHVAENIRDHMGGPTSNEVAQEEVSRATGGRKVVMEDVKEPGIYVDDAQ